MKIFIAAALISLAALGTATAQQPAPAPGVPDFAKMQEMQAKWDAIKKKKREERRVIKQQIVEEEIAKARANASPGVDPMSVADRAALKRLAPLEAQWKKEDQAREAEMMQGGGPGMPPAPPSE